jgi:hypothetical protein
VEKRSEPRLAIAAEVRVDVLGDKGCTLDAELADLSSRGMRLFSRTSIQTDAALRIHLDADLYLGEVTYCQATYCGRGYHIGVSLFNVMRNAAAVSERLNRILVAR